MKRRVLPAVLPVIVLVVLAGPGDATSADPGAVGVTRGQPWTGSPGTQVSVATLMARQRAADQRGTTPTSGQRPEPGIVPPPPQQSGSQAVPLRTGAAAVAPKSELSASTSFLGASSADSPFRPPDSMGAVGPTQVLVTVNGRFRLLDKNGTNPGILDVTDATFWGTEAGGLDVTDPQVEYDRLAGRWVITQINFDSTDPNMVNNRIMVAVSSDSTITPSTTWTFHHFLQNDPNPGASALFADYDQMGVDANAIYVGTNDFNSSGNFAGTTAFVIRKSTAASSGALVVTAFRGLTTGGFGAPGPDSPQPAEDMDPNVGEGYIVGVDNASLSVLDVRRISDPGGTPSITGNLQVPIATTTEPDRPSGCGSPNFCVPASGSTKGLDALDNRLYEAMIGRDEAGALSLWTAHNIEVNSSGVASSAGGRDGARWYQIGNLSATPTLTQAGTLFDPASTNPRYFWIPSIAMNGQGHASLNSSAAGNGRFAEVAGTAHLASDPTGTTEPFQIIQSSSSAYGDTDTPDPSRWGDYSQTAVDPNDNQTFWTFQEYAVGSADWGVRVIKLLAPPPATPSLSTPDHIGLGLANVLVTITGAQANGSGFFDPGPDTGGPGYPNHISASVTGGTIVNSVAYVDPTHVTLDLNTTSATNGSQNVTITNPDGQSLTGQNILVTGTDVTPPAPPIFGGTIPTSPANNNNPLIFGSAEGGSAVRLYTNPSCSGSPAATGSASQFASGLAVTVPDNSTTTFYGTATDISSNTSACSSTVGAAGSVTYREDSTLPPSPAATPTTPPQTTITKAPKKTRKRRPKFKFTSNEAGVTFRCRLDKGRFAPCTSPFRPPKLKLGKHVLQVVAVDSAGMADPTPAVRKFKVLPPA
jgi:hypothetical protein